jgi:hypothetical protein
MVYDAYNLTINGDGVLPVMQGANSLMFGWFGIIALLAIGVILFLSFMAYSSNLKKSLGISSVICVLVCIGFRMLEIVADNVVLITIIIAAIIVTVSLLIPD